MKKILVLLSMAGLIGISACSTEEEGGDLVGTRSQAELTIISDEAALNSLIPVEYFTEVTVDNVMTAKVSTEPLEKVGEVVLSAAGYVEALKMARLWANRRVQTAALNVSNSMVLRPEVRFQSSGNVDEITEVDIEAVCQDGGTAIGTGAFHVVSSVSGTKDSGLISSSVDVEDLTLLLAACGTGIWTFWGEILKNEHFSKDVKFSLADNFISYEIVIANHGTQDGGLAISDGSTHFNFPFAMGYRLSATGDLVDYFKEEVVWGPVTLSSTFKIGNITCAISETDPDIIFSDAGVPDDHWVCN